MSNNSSGKSGPEKEIANVESYVVKPHISASAISSGAKGREKGDDSIVPGVSHACICLIACVRTRICIPHTGKEYPMADFVRAARKKNIAGTERPVNRAFPIENKDFRDVNVTRDRREL